MVYTVTFNPALDYAMYINEFNLGATNRSLSEEITIGGKGINVSYILNQFDIPNIALGFVAGFTGEKLMNLANQMGIKNDFIVLKDGNTRINVKLKGKIETEINAKGPIIDDYSLDCFFNKLDALKSGDTLVLSGSVSGGLNNDIYEQILNKINNKNIKICVDATGDLLKNTLKFCPFVIKPNTDELEDLVGQKLNSFDEIVSAAKVLQTMGAQNVLVSMGKDGAILLDSYGNVYFEKAKSIVPINTVGAGDSMLAGFICGCEKGYEYALKLGNACGGATAASNFLATKDEILSLM